MPEENANAWTGEGLPPVGTVCKFKSKGVEKWSECHVKYQFENGEAVVAICGPREAVLWVSGFDFRPVRTPEQIATEEREAAIAEIAQEISSCLPYRPDALAKALHDAGYRKSVTS